MIPDVPTLPPPPSRRVRALSLAALAALLGLVALVFWPGLTSGFVFDDYPNIVLNPALHVHDTRLSSWNAAALSSPAGDLKRPLSMVTFAVNHYFTGLQAWPMKATNLAIHCLNAVLAYLAALSLFACMFRTVDPARRSTAALLAAGFWSVFPINVVAVLLTVQRMELLAQSFVLLGLWLYMLGRTRQLEGRGGTLLAPVALVACTAVGILAKESAALLPAYTLVLEAVVFRLRGRDGRLDPKLASLYAAIAMVGLIGLAWLLPRVSPAAYVGRDFTLAERLMTEGRVLVDYLHWTVIPDLGKLSLFHDDYPVSRSLWSPASTLPSIAALVLLAWVGLLLRHSRPLAAIGIAFFLSAHILTATVVPLEIMFEHRNYFSSFGVALVLVDLVVFMPIPARRKLFLAAGFALLALYAVDTRLRTMEWQNPLKLALTEAAKHPESPRAMYQLGQAYTLQVTGPRSPFVAAAFEQFERARRIPRANILPVQGALMLAAKLGLPPNPEWWPELQARLRNQPIGPQEHGALAAMTECAILTHCPFPPDEMTRTYASALARGEDAEVLNLFGNYAFNVLRDPQLALTAWKSAQRLRPLEPQYLISLAKISMTMGDRAGARRYIEELRKLSRHGQYQPEIDELEVRMRGR